MEQYPPDLDLLTPEQLILVLDALDRPREPTQYTCENCKLQHSKRLYECLKPLEQYL